MSRIIFGFISVECTVHPAQSDITEICSWDSLSWSCFFLVKFSEQGLRQNQTLQPMLSVGCKTAEICSPLASAGGSCVVSGEEVPRRCSKPHGATERWCPGEHSSWFIGISCLANNPWTEARPSGLAWRLLQSLENLISCSHACGCRRACAISMELSQGYELCWVITQYRSFLAKAGKGWKPASTCRLSLEQNYCDLTRGSEKVQLISKFQVRTSSVSFWMNLQK